MTPSAPTQPADILAFPDPGERRLRLALRQLDAALTAQREAVKTFRDELTALRLALGGLETSAIELRGRLGEAAEDALQAQEAATALMRTAEAMEQVAEPR